MSPIAASDRYPEEEPRFGTTTRWKGKRLLTKAERLARQRARARRWRVKNREKLRLYFREYRAGHPSLKQYLAAYYKNHRSQWAGRAKSERAQAARREYRKKHGPRLNAMRREWNRKNPDRARAIEARHRMRRREEKRRTDRVYRQQKAEIYKASIAKAKAKKPDLYRQHAVQSALKRRARQKAATIERVSIRRVISRDGSTCHLCATLVEPQHRSIDHLIPIARGGAHAEWNLMTAHLSCNKRRGTKQILTEETKQAAEAYIAARSEATR